MHSLNTKYEYPSVASYILGGGVELKYFMNNHTTISISKVEKYWVCKLMKETYRSVLVKVAQEGPDLAL